MKKILPFLFAAFFVFACSKDEYEGDGGAVYDITEDTRGEVSSYKLNNYNQGYSGSSDFFSLILNTEEEDIFEQIETGVTADGVVFEKYLEFCNGIPVKDGNYTLYKKGGVIIAAEGTYIRVGQMDTDPAVNVEAATGVWCKSLNTAIPDMSLVRSQLIIALPETGTDGTPLLLYSIYLRNVRPANTAIGYIDAVSAQLVGSEPIYIF